MENTDSNPNIWLWTKVSADFVRADLEWKAMEWKARATLLFLAQSYPLLPILPPNPNIQPKPTR